MHAFDLIFMNVKIEYASFDLFCSAVQTFVEYVRHWHMPLLSLSLVLHFLVTIHSSHVLVRPGTSALV